MGMASECLWALPHGKLCVSSYHNTLFRLCLCSQTRNLYSLLEKSPHRTSRVLWTSSIEARPDAFTFDDWQLTTTPLSYEASKYQTHLVSHGLDLRNNATSEGKVRHIVVHPGVVATSIFAVHLGWLLYWLMTITFYLVRLSPSLLFVLLDSLSLLRDPGPVYRLSAPSNKAFQRSHLRRTHLTRFARLPPLRQSTRRIWLTLQHVRKSIRRDRSYRGMARRSGRYTENAG